MFSILEHDHFQVLSYLKAILYDPKNDSKNRDVTPKMLFILGLCYRSHYRCYSYNLFVKQLYFLEIQMVCFVLFQSEISYSKLTSCKSIDLSQKRKLFEIIRCLILFSVFSFCVSIHTFGLLLPCWLVLWQFTFDASEYTKYHLSELRRKIWRHDWSSQSKPNSLKKIHLWPAPSWLDIMKE